MKRIKIKNNEQIELRKIIKEEIRSVLSERKIGTPEELKQYLYSRQSDIVGWIKDAIENHGEDIKQWISDDAGEITPGEFQLTYDDFAF